MSKVAMIGCGAWGMALACHLSRSGHDVTVWCHSEEAAAKLTAERLHFRAFNSRRILSLRMMRSLRRRAAT